MTRIQSGRLLLLLILLSLALTWPLVAHITTHVPGDGIDDPALAWNLWWAKYSWVDRAGEQGLAHNVFDGDVMFYPVGINLAFYTLTLLNGALSIPLQSALSLILANNLLLLSSFVLSGFGAYLLALEVLGLARSRAHAPALFAALLYAFASTKLFYASLGQFNIASSQWLPFIALYLMRSLRATARPRDGFLLGLFLLFQTWAELTYGAFAVLLIALVTAGAAAWRFWPSSRGHSVPSSDSEQNLASDNAHHPTFSIQRLIFNVAIAGFMFALGLAPYLANMLPELRVEGDFLVQDGGFADIFSADLLGFLFPTQLHPLFGGIIRAIADDSALRPDRSQFMVNKGQHLFFGYTAMLLAAYGLWNNRRRAWAWGAAALTAFFWLLALGPVVRVNGYETGIPGLFPLLLKIPFFQANRYPSRYSVLILLGLALLAALGLAALMGRVRASRRKALALSLTGLLLFEHLSIPLPLSDFRLPPAYKAVVTDPRPAAVLDLPIGWRNGFNVFGKSDVIIMYTQWWQTYHHKPRLGGNTSRNPEHKFQYFLENPVIGVLVALQDGREVSPTDFARAQALAPDLLRFLNIRQTLVHRDRVPADFEQNLSRLFPLDFVDAQGNVARYEARWPAEPENISLEADDLQLKTYLQEGWGVVNMVENRPIVWATRPTAKLLLPALQRPTKLTLTLFAPGNQTLALFLDDDELARAALFRGFNTLTFSIPPANSPFPRRLTLRADKSFDPDAIRFAPRDIGSTGVQSPVNLVVRSAGKEVGDFGHIYVNGKEMGPNRRGYNLVAINPADGRVLGSANFDTHAPYLAPAPSAALSAWVQALPSGVIVAGAVRDAAALGLGDDAIAALRSLGVATDIRGGLRRAHGFIGVKGAAPESALEAASEAWPVTLAVGDGLTEPNPAFALAALSIK